MKDLKEKLGRAYYVLMDCIGIAIGLIISYCGRTLALSKTIAMIFMVGGLIIICFFGVLLVRLNKVSENADTVKDSNFDESEEESEDIDDVSDKDAEIERLKAQLHDVNNKLQEYESSSADDVFTEFEEFLEDEDMKEGE